MPPYARVVEASAWVNGSNSRASVSAGDADAGVAHREAHDHAVVRRRRQLRATHDLAALGELDGVAEQVDEDLAQPAGSPRSAARDVRVDAARAAPGPWLVRARREQLARRPRRPSRRSNVDGLELELAGLDLREVEDVVDDRRAALSPERCDRLGVARAARSVERRCRAAGRSCRGRRSSACGSRGSCWPGTRT